MNISHNRLQLLTRLLEANDDLQLLQQSLRQHPWDAPHPLVEMTRTHLLHVCDLVDASVKNYAWLEEWANLIEGRDDIGFPMNEVGTRMKNTIFQLANPTLYGNMNREKIEQIRHAMTE